MHSKRKRPVPRWGFVFSAIESERKNFFMKGTLRKVLWDIFLGKSCLQHKEEQHKLIFFKKC